MITGSMKMKNRASSVYEISRLCLFIFFYLMALRYIWVYATFLPIRLSLPAGCGILAVMAFCYWRIQWALYLFIIFIPLISGFQVLGCMKFAPILSFGFSIIYAVWLPMRLWKTGEGIEPRTSVGNYLDILSGIIILSLFYQLHFYPVPDSVQKFFYAEYFGQHSPFWSIEATYIILNGFFFFRILELEIKAKNEWLNFTKILYIHLITILFFSYLQFVFDIPPPVKKWGKVINSPFNDLHSYGGYTSLLFFIFLNQLFSFTSAPQGGASQKPIFVGISVGLSGLFVLLLFSGSTATLIWMIVIACFFAAKRITVKKMAIVVIVLLSSLLIFNLLSSSSTNWMNTERSIAARYGKRLYLRNIPQVLSGRFKSWDQAAGMIKEYPMTGCGVGSFYRICGLFSLSGDLHPDRVENAHNYYLQFCAELGIPALLLFVLLLYCLFKMGTAVLDRRTDYSVQVRGALLGLIAYLSTMMTSHHLLLSNQQFLFWFIVAIVLIPYHFPIAGEASMKGICFHSPSIPLWILIASIAVGYGCRLHGNYDEKRIKAEEYGLYGKEKLDGERIRWTSKNAVTFFESKNNIFVIKIKALPWNTSTPDGLECNFFLNDLKLDTVRFFGGGVKRLYYWQPSIIGKKVSFRVDVGKTFNRYRLGIDRDMRNLGIAVSPVSFLKILPKGGVGFHEWETMDASEFPFSDRHSAKETIEFRWTGMRATMPLNYFAGQSSPEFDFYLRCTHPDIEKNPVIVTILEDHYEIWEEVFLDQKWKKTKISLKHPHESGTLTYRVNRTWNPRAVGISDDGRELGVAVVTLKRKQ